MARTGRAEEWSWKARPRSDAALPIGDVGFESRLVGVLFMSNNSKRMIMKKNFSKWMRRNNMVFSAMAGETFTNAEVVYTHIGLVAFLIVMGLAGSL